MKTKTFLKLLFVLIPVSALFVISCDKEPVGLSAGQEDMESVNSLKAGNNGAATYIVILNEDFEATAELAGKRGYDVRKSAMTGYLNRFLSGKAIGSDQLEQVYTNALLGFSVKLSGPQLERLSKDPRVNRIDPDQVVDLGRPAPVPVPSPAQVVPPGITRVGGGTTYTGGKKAWIIDTGVDYTHPDLVVNTTLAKSFVTRVTTAKDDNGHGSHVAGIIAAKNNTIGVVGVAAGATVVPVKVLDKRGSGSMSWIIAGVDYVTEKAAVGDVANMSLGGSPYELLDLAVINLGKKGVFVALAAGNESDNANNHSPARANGLNIYTVSAMDKYDVWASFSNYGNPPVDYCAPGVSIYSCYKGGAYATMSGTSMAAPHVAGVLLLTGALISTSGYVSNDPDGNPDPIAHK